MTQPSQHATRTSRYVNQKSGKTIKNFNIRPPWQVASPVNVINARLSPVERRRAMAGTR